MSSLYESLLEKMDGIEYSGYFATCCIFHGDEHPSLFVYEDGTFRCAACHKHGSLEYLARKLGHVSIPLTRSQSSNILPRWKSWERKWGDLNGIATYAHENLLRYPQFQSYFKRRQINEYIEKGCLGFIDGWAVFPVFDSGHTIVDCVVRAIKGKRDSRYVVCSLSANSTNRQLYVPNWGRVKEAKVVYIPFGIVDCIGLELLGLPTATGITGKAVPIDRLRELHKKIIIVPDRDEEEDAHRIANQFGMGAKVKTLRFPDDCKDPDDIKIKYGNEYLLSLIGA